MTISEYYKYYLTLHQHPKCKLLHFIGQLVTIIFLFWVISNWYWYILSAEDQWSFDARIVTEKIMKDVRKLNRKIKPLPVLLTKYISSSSQSVQMKKAALKAFKSSIVKTPITYSTVVAKSHSKRQSIHESSPNHQIAQEYDKVAESISNFINKKKK